MDLETKRNANLMCAETGDIAWMGPNLVYLVSQVGTESNIKIIVVNL